MSVYNKIKQTHRYREETSVYQWGEGNRQRQISIKGVRDTNGYEENIYASRIYCIAQGNIENVL